MIEKPVFVIGAPRSGTTFIFRAMSLYRELWHLGKESHAIFEGPFRPNLYAGESNQILDREFFSSNKDKIEKKFYQNVINFHQLGISSDRYLNSESISEKIVLNMQLKFARHHAKSLKQGPLRLLEKTPKNCLRIPFIDFMFPDAKYIYITRAPKTNINSLLRGWNSHFNFFGVKVDRFNRNGYDIPRDFKISGSEFRKWNFALIPNWKDLNGASLLEICSQQYTKCNSIAYHDLVKLGSDRFLNIKQEDLLADPASAFRAIEAFCDLKRTPELDSFVSSSRLVNSISQGHEEFNGFDTMQDAFLQELAEISRELGYEFSV